jgi:D-amino-acid dehydrogenase
VHLFTTALAAARAAGVDFQYSTTVTRLLLDGESHRRGMHRRARAPPPEHADAVVVAMGSFSAPLLQPLGIRLMLYPGKGYSATYPILDPASAPTVSLTDDGHKLVFSRLGERLRVAGTCELNGYTRELNPVRCAAITRRVQALFPHACDYGAPVYWAGLRPHAVERALHRRHALPSAVPQHGPRHRAGPWAAARAGRWPTSCRDGGPTSILRFAGNAWHRSLRQRIPGQTRRGNIPGRIPIPQGLTPALT